MIVQGGRSICGSSSAGRGEAADQFPRGGGGGGLLGVVDHRQNEAIRFGGRELRRKVPDAIAVGVVKSLDV
jgi:hypothetical protein